MRMFVTLVGPQDVDVTAYRPGTDGAAIGVRIGGALLHLTDAETVSTFLMVWMAGGAHGRALPGLADQSRVAPMSGTALPAAYMEAGDSPPARARLRRGRPGQPTRLWVSLGQMTFNVVDREALATTTSAFLRAARIAPGVFPVTSDQRAVERTAAAAARLLAPPPRREPRPGAPRQQPAAIRPTAPRSSSRELTR